MDLKLRSSVFPFGEARKAIPGPAGEHASTVLQRGTVRLLLSLPVAPNRQSPHTQDEIYVIVNGRGFFWHDGRRDAVSAGDAIFVAAGTEHHFEDFTNDLTVWVIFYGPAGGEVPSE